MLVYEEERPCLVFKKLRECLIYEVAWLYLVCKEASGSNVACSVLGARHCLVYKESKLCLVYKETRRGRPR